MNRCTLTLWLSCILLVASTPWTQAIHAGEEAASVSGTSSVTVTGIVFSDDNASGKKDNEEKGLSKVCVSDGVTCVLTNAEGHYSLKTSAGGSRIVFVVTPTGYEHSTDFYRRIPPEVPQSTADFCLLPAAKTKDPNFSFVQISDTHVRNASDSNILAAALNEIQPLEPAFVVVTGDLINNGHGLAPGMYPHYRKACESFALPIYHALGNHDLPVKVFEDALGPSYYSFNYGGRHFVVLNCMSDMPQQLDWLDEDISMQPEGVELLVFQHYAPNKELLTFLSHYNTRAIFSGHWHSSKVFQYGNIWCVNTPSVRYGGLAMSPRGFRRVSFQDGELILEDRLGGCKRHLTIVSPTDGATFAAGTIQIKANAYDVSSRVSKVEYRIDEEPWKEMTSIGTWAWEGQCAGKAPGSYGIQVRASFESGMLLEEQTAFEVTEDVLAYPNPGSDWPMFQHDPARTGATGDVVKPPLHLAWSKSLDSRIHIASPVVAHGTVYIGLQDEEMRGKAGVYALDAKTGDIRWKYETLTSVKNSVAVANNLVYAMTVNGNVYALDAETGKEIWSYSLGNGIGQRAHSSPVVSGDIVYLGVATHFVALDAQTGKRIWQAAFLGMKSLLGAEFMGCYSSPCIGKERVYVGFNLATGHLALDKQNGKQLWNKQYWRDPIHASPTLFKDTLYQPAYGKLYAMKAETGEDVWSFPLPAENPFFMGWTMSSPAISGSKVYIGSLDGRIFALDISTGEKLWSYQTGEAMASFSPYVREGSQVISSPSVSGNTVYLGSTDGRLYALDTESGKEMWRYDLGVPLTSSPAISGNTVYVAAYDGSIYAFTQISKLPLGSD